MLLAFTAWILAVSFIPRTLYDVHSELICGHVYLSPNGLKEPFIGVHPISCI